MRQRRRAAPAQPAGCILSPQSAAHAGAGLVHALRVQVCSRVFDD